MSNKSHFKEMRMLLSAFLIFTFSIIGTNVSYAADAEPQPRNTITGIVVDNTGTPIPGATVSVKRNLLTVIVLDDGSFSISAVEGDVLLVSMLGYRTEEVQITGNTNYKVTLTEDALNLDAVVVVGYGTQKKATVTGAINNVTNEQIMSSPTASVSNSLAGKITGLTSVQRSGEPGKDGATFKVRGIGTLNSGNESAPLIMIDGVERSSLDMLDPNEIESVNVLKDASATAVYGVRGANGVILVTTKKGEPGKARVSFSSNFGWQTYTMLPDFVNAYDWATLYNEGVKNEGIDHPVFSDEAFQAYKTKSNPVIYPDVDWVDMMFKKNAPQQSYNTNVSGGTEKVKYFISMGMLHQEGMYKDYAIEGLDYSINPDYYRYNFRANLDINVTDNLKIDVQLGTIFTDGHFSGNTTKLIFDYLTRSIPGSNIGILDNKLISGYTGDDDPLEGIRVATNPYLLALENGYQDVNTSTYNLNVNVDYNLDYLTKGLSLSGKIAYDDYGIHTVSYVPSGIPEYKVVVDNSATDGYYLVKSSDQGDYSASETYGSTRYRNVYLEAAVSYNRRFGDHTVTGLLLYNQKTSNSPTYEYDLPKGLLGVVGRVTYNYANRYLAEFDIGYNGSENFAKGRRFGFFPAVSGGWIVSEEPFFPKSDLVTFLKVRGSYGEVGNDQIGGSRYLYLPSSYTYGSGGYNWGTDGLDSQYYYGTEEGVVGNPNVTWERAKKSDVGFDLKMFGSRLNVTTDLFWENRSNILWEYGTIPATVGAELSASNLGKVSNQGVEVEANWNANIGRDFSYMVGLSYSYAKNKIVFMDEAAKAYDYLLNTGYSVDQYKGYVNDGFINTTADLENQPAHSWGGNYWGLGELKFVDVNGDGVVNSNDQVTIGYGPYPEITFGLTLGASYKGFAVNALIQGATNVSLYLNQSAVLALYYQRSATEWHMERWSQERYDAGETITYPRVLYNAIYSPSFLDQNPLSTFWLYDASYVRLKNLELSYTLANDVLKLWGIANIKIYTNGSNLLTFSGVHNFDPESPSGAGTFYPMQKVYNAGIKIVFK